MIENMGKDCDVLIIGGGLAGLALSIQLSKQQYKVILLEKDTYPRHKVCGEYISMESKPFLQSLDIPVDDMSLPVIDKLLVTDSRGNRLSTALPQGGFGISRYKLEMDLALLAQNAGVTLLTKIHADDVQWNNDYFTITANKEKYTAKVVCGTWGKHSNMDVHSKRPFIMEKRSARTNYLGIKYHIRYPWAADVIGLHNFRQGYCGISQIEDDMCCLCYLTTADLLHKSGNDIKKMERDVLMKNPELYKIFSKAEFLYEAPMAISQVSFKKKEHVLDHVLLAGDAAGMITPLCGNGMSIAFHTSRIAFGLVDRFLQGKMTRQEMETEYNAAWEKNFSRRTAIGRIVQHIFGREWITAMFIKTMKHLPFLHKPIIRRTAGKPF